ncbi:DUF5317 domain-containing protein [Pseudothermotoga sp. U03pept]|uniref:DUF5317 domain-containing protein n=1 Tax=Pseudothermotoga sp. U03pept TaxID=3447012 RepID=UPI003F0A20F5
MILDVFVVAVVLSVIFKKRIYHLHQVHVKMLYLFPIPFVIQLLPFAHRGVLMAISYGILFLIVLLNTHLRGFKLIAVGSLMNASVILLNSGRMPVYEPFARSLGLDLTIKHTFVDSFSLKLLFGDWIPVILPWGRRFLISPGDIFVYLGVFLFLLTIDDRGKITGESS